jgi:HlyD family secretion protein
MAANDPKVYREKALTRFASADNLEHLVPAVHLREWMAVAVTGTLFGLLLAWSFIGSVPTVVTGRGILILPRRIVHSQALTGGRLVSLNVRPGDIVKRGQLIGRLDQSDIRKRIEEEQANVAELQQQDRTKTAFDQQRLALQSQQDALERKSLEVMRLTLLQSLQSAESLIPLLEKRRDAIRELVRSGILGTAAREVSDVEAAANDNQIRIQDLKARLAVIDGNLKQIETRAATQSRETLELSMSRQNQVSELRRAIEINKLQLSRNGEILSENAGRVVEVLVSAGQVLQPGGPLLSLEVEDPDQVLTCITYFPIADGKKIQPGMTVQVTPDIVERQRFGGILGSVVSVSSLPVTREGALSIIGNADVVQSLLTGGGHIEVISRLENDPSTFSQYKWSSSRGPSLKITAGITTSTRVRVEGRAPITYLLPILRETTGVY